MGLDISYKSIPSDCALLERARLDPEFGVNLEFFARYAVLPEAHINRNDNAPAREFIVEAKKVLADHPGTDQRHLSLGRRWDMLYYLLSEDRQLVKPRDASNWVVKALFGSEVLNEKTVTSIGSPIRYSNPTEVHLILQNLSGISAEAIRTYWDPQAMDDAAVYKINPEDNDEVFEWLVKGLEALTAFYAEASMRNEGVLIFIS